MDRTFVARRMDHLRDELMHKGLWNEEDDKVYQQVRMVMINELEAHQSKPSLLHGDLWGGNYMFLTDGRPALFDPAPLYGDREFDLGITTVFGVLRMNFMMNMPNTILWQRCRKTVGILQIIFIYGSFIKIWWNVCE